MKPQIKTIETYIALNNPQGAAKVLAELGAPRIISNDDLLNKIHFATKQFGEKAFDKLAQIDTPYRRLILTEYSKNKHSNCSGCGGSCGFDGSWELANQAPAASKSSAPAHSYSVAPVPEPNAPIHTSTNRLAVAAVVLLGVLTVSIIVKK